MDAAPFPVLVVALQAELAEAARRVHDRVQRLPGARVHLANPGDPLPAAELTVVLLGAGVGGTAGAAGMAAALARSGRVLALFQDGLKRAQIKPWADDQPLREALLTDHEALWIPFDAPEAVLAAFEPALQRWLGAHRPTVHSLHAAAQDWLLSQRTRWERGNPSHLLEVLDIGVQGRAQTYVSLHVAPGRWRRDAGGQPVLRREREAPEPDDKKQEPIFLDELLSLPALRVALVEGEAGAGKTVLLQHVALCLAHAHLGWDPPAESRFDAERLRAKHELLPVPVLVEASALATRLHAARSAEEAVLGLLGDLLTGWPPLREELHAGRIALLVDALDEVPDARRRRAVVDGLVACARAWPRLRVVLSSRPGVGVVAPPPFETVTVGDLDADRRGALIGRWVAAQDLPPQTADEVAPRLSALEGRFSEDPSGRSPLSNPLLCTAALLVYWKDRALPDNTADLYDRLVAALCRSRPDPAQGETEAVFRRRLQRVCRATQQTGGTALPMAQAAGVLMDDEGGTLIGNEQKVTRLVTATGLLRTENTAQGVVVRPWHRSFQSYLTAASLDDDGRDVREIAAGLAEPGPQRVAPLLDDFWTEALRLSFGVFGLAGARVHRARQLADVLLERAAWAADRANEAEGAARAQALREEGHLLALVAAGVKEYRRAIFGGVLSELPGRVAERYEVGGVYWGWRDRIAALDALGALGDPRLEGPACWVWVPGRRVRIGGDSGAFRSLPAQDFDCPDLWVRRHPVTVGEYAAFLASSPERDATLWEGRARPEPEDWLAQHEQRNRPVTGVDWYAARAFCRWAQRRWTLPVVGVVDLPSSREWEAIALGDRGGPYPWGEPAPGQGDAARACYAWDGATFREPAPVGAFPAGHAGGLWDLAGNVWEWCATAWISDVEERDVLLSPTGQVTIVNDTTGRVLRGGAWNLPSGGLRAADRDGFRAGSRVRYFGFRVVVRVPPASAFVP